MFEVNTDELMRQAEQLNTIFESLDQCYSQVDSVIDQLRMIENPALRQVTHTINQYSFQYWLHRWKRQKLREALEGIIRVYDETEERIEDSSIWDKIGDIHIIRIPTPEIVHMMKEDLNIKIKE